MDPWKNPTFDVNSWGITLDDFIQEWVRQNRASTSQLEPSKENVGASIEASPSNPLGSLYQNSFNHAPGTTLNPELTFQPGPSVLPESFEINNRALGKQPMFDIPTQFDPPVRDLHQETSNTNIMGSIDEIPDYNQVFDWLVEDSWAFICNYDRKARKFLDKRKSTGVSTAEIPQNVEPEKPYKIRKGNTTLTVFGKEVDVSWFPTPVCSCTGIPRECRWCGEGGWSSACCTATLSAYPLPKTVGRTRGRRMGLGMYSKVLEGMYNNGHDFCTPIDLKDHWAKHGSNKFVVIR